MNIRILLNTVGFVSLSTWAAAQSDIDRANQAYSVRSYKEAINLYEQGLAKTPTDLNAQVNLAYAYFITNNPQKSADWYERVLKNPEAIGAHPFTPYFYSEALRMLGQYAKAKEIVQKLPSQYQSIINACTQSSDFAQANDNAPVVFRARNESSVNSTEADYAPAFYKNKLIFASSRVVQLTFLGGGYSDATYNWLYGADRNGNSGQLSNAQLLYTANELATTNNAAPASFSKDGARVAYMINSLTSGIRHLPDVNLRAGEIEIANASSASKWENDISGAFEHYKNIDGVIVGFPTLSADGKTLYFSSNVNSGYGGFDIFVSFFQNGRWSEPQNLGANVNTMGDELAPFAAEDGTLYFSSNFHKGFGGYDVFRASFDEERNVWRDVRNMGKGVNSSYDDLYFVFDDGNNQGYVASNRTGGQGDYDIYSVELIGNEAQLASVLDNERNDVVVHYPPAPKTNTVVNTTTSPKPTNTTTTFNSGNTTKPATNTTATKTDKMGTKPTPPTKTPTTPTSTATATTNSDPNETPCAMNFYIGAITDATTQQPIADAIVYIKNMRTQVKEKANSNRFGEYSVLLDPMTEYMLVISKEGYQNDVFQVDTKTGGQRTLLGSRRLQRAATLGDTDVFGDPVATTPMSKTLDKASDFTKTSKKYSTTAPSKVVPDTGYLVQVGAFAKLGDDVLLKLSEYGNVITEKGKNGLTVYRVGVYADKNHAQQMLNELRKNGFPEAWRITTPIDNKTLAGKLANSSQIVYPPVMVADEPINEPITTPVATIKENTYSDWADNSTAKPATNATKSRSLSGTTASTTTTATRSMAQQAKFAKGIEYKVQLGAFRDPEKVSFSQIEELGILEMQLGDNGLTYFYLAGYKSLDAAQRAKSLAIERGTQSPFVVAFKNGVRVPLSEVAATKTK